MDVNLKRVTRITIVKIAFLYDYFYDFYFELYRRRNNEIQEKECACSTNNYEWMEWSECTNESKSDRCDVKSTRWRRMSCYPNCADKSTSEMTEESNCVLVGCEYSCCKAVEVSIPDDLELSSDSFLVTYYQIQSGDFEKALYRGKSSDQSEERFLFFNSGVGMWVIAEEAGSATEAGFYRSGRTECPDEELTGKNWNYYNHKWKSHDELRIKCVDNQSEAENETELAPLPDIVSTASPNEQAYSTWAEWSSDCMGVRCGEGRNFRSRKCLDESGTAKIALLDEFGNGTDAKSAVLDDPSCDLEQLEEVKSCFVDAKCPSKCCSRIELIVEKESGQKNLQVHRNGIYYQR